MLDLLTTAILQLSKLQLIRALNSVVVYRLLGLGLFIKPMHFLNQLRIFHL